MYDELLGKELCEVEKILDKNGEKYKIVLTSPPREEKIIKKNSRLLRIKTLENEVLELLVCNTYSDNKKNQGDLDVSS